jgi:AcrR family transcriptional regulator
VPRAGLSAEVVTAEAARLADEVGYDALTLAGVAERFGVAAPSLYKHVRGLDGLQRELSVLAVRELAGELARAVMGKAGGDALRAVAVAYRDWARRHPGRYAATLRAPDPDDAGYVAASEEALAVLLAVLQGYDLKGDDAIDAIRALRSALHGFVSLDALGGFGLPRSVDRSFDRLVTAFDGVLAGWAGGTK